LIERIKQELKLKKDNDLICLEFVVINGIINESNVEELILIATAFKNSLENIAIRVSNSKSKLPLLRPIYKQT